MNHLQGMRPDRSETHELASTARALPSNNRRGSEETQSEPQTDTSAPTPTERASAFADRIKSDAERLVEEQRALDHNDPLGQVGQIFGTPDSFVTAAMLEFARATEDVLRIPEQLAKLQSLLPELGSILHQLLRMAADPQIRQQLIVQVPVLLGDVTLNALFGEIGELWNQANTAFRAGEYRVANTHMTQISFKIVSLILIIRSAIKIIRNLPEIVGRLSSRLRRLHLQLERFRRRASIELPDLRHIDNLEMRSRTDTENVTQRGEGNNEIEEPFIDGSANNRGITQPSDREAAPRSRRARQERARQRRRRQASSRARRRRFGQRRRRQSELRRQRLEERRIAGGLTESDVSHRRTAASEQIQFLINRPPISDAQRALFRVNAARRRDLQSRAFGGIYPNRRVQLHPDRPTNYANEEYLPGGEQFGRTIFRENMIDRIIESPGHPLEFLLDIDRGGFWPADRSGLENANRIAVHAGHRRDFRQGVDESFALQDAHANWREGARFTGIRESIDISGVPVDLQTAELWVRLGLLSAAVVRLARRSPGFVVRMPSD